MELCDWGKSYWVVFILIRMVVCEGTEMADKNYEMSIVTDTCLHYCLYTGLTVEYYFSTEETQSQAPNQRLKEHMVYQWPNSRT